MDEEAPHVLGKPPCGAGLRLIEGRGWEVPGEELHRGDQLLVAGNGRDPPREEIRVAVTDPGGKDNLVYKVKDGGGMELPGRYESSGLALLLKFGIVCECKNGCLPVEEVQSLIRREDLLRDLYLSPSKLCYPEIPFFHTNLIFRFSAYYYKPVFLPIVCIKGSHDTKFRGLGAVFGQKTATVWDEASSFGIASHPILALLPAIRI